MSDHEITTQESEQTEERAERLSGAVTKTVSTLFDVGKLWAAHGLSIGRSALETSAATLKTTAGLLGDLSERFSSEAEKNERDAA
jgi:hypothetical protein